MELQRLPSDVISKIRSSFSINTLTQCVIELVLNSLDAKSTAVAIRLNLVAMKIQVVDNGNGISKENMKLLGKRHMTNKCANFKEFEKHIKYYGYRGEALASIVECSQAVNIISKSINSSETHCKQITRHSKKDVKTTKFRPSSGTTVTVEGFFHNFPVRKNRIVAELELNDIKKNIEGLIIMHPRVSFSIRNEVNGEMIVNAPKRSDIVTSFKYLHPEINGISSLMKVSKNRVSVEALFFKEVYGNKNLQYIFVNKRPVFSNKIKRITTDLLLANMKKEKKQSQSTGKKFPVYVVNIKCPHSYVDILNCTKTIVQFKNLEVIMTCLKKLIYAFFEKELRPRTNDKNRLTPEEKLHSTYGASLINGMIKSFGHKKKSPCEVGKSNNVQDEDIIAETQFSSREVYRKRKNKTDTKGLKKTKEMKIFQDHTTGPAIKQLMSYPDDYNITDTTSIPFAMNYKFKKPLSIFTKNKDITIDEKDMFTKNNRNTDVLNLNTVTYKEKDDTSDLSKFTSNENKGKNLIMNMFLKSTQVYSSDDIISDEKSEETIFEIESNFQMENNCQTYVNGKSKAMSISVNVKQSKKIKRPKCKVGKVGKKNQTSKCIQTTFNNNNEVSSKCIQTSLDITRFKKDNQLEKNIFDYTKKSAADYTILFGNTAGTPQFEIVDKNKIWREDKTIQAPTENKCCCHCHSDGKIFNFSENAQTVRQIFGRNLQCSPFYNDVKDNQRNKNSVFQPGMLENNLRTDTYINRKSHITNIPDQSITDRSPYFRKSYPVSPQVFCKHFIPNCLCTTSEPKNIQNLDPITTWSFGNQNEVLKSVDAVQSETNINSFSNFKPFYVSTQANRSLNNGEDIFRSGVFETDRSRVLDFTKTSKPTKESSELFITLNKEEQFNMIERELETEKFLAVQKMLNEEIQSTNLTMAEEHIPEKNCFADWIMKFNNHGNYYLNTKTGFTTFCTPKPVKNFFKIDQRFDFMPKGMSPILKETKTVDKSLSQNSKDKLLEYIMDNYRNELIFIKWQKYLKNIDPKTFFANIYKEKIKTYKNCVPNINFMQSKEKCNTEAISFTKDLFDNIDVIGQLDKKFVITIKRDSNMLIVFDQHAVHERVRLEQLLKEYKNAKKYRLREKITLFVAQNDLPLLKKHKAYIISLGISLDFFTNGIHIIDIPQYLNKQIKEHNSTNDTLKKIVQALINEITELLKTRAANLFHLPKVIQNIINMDACKGAIKFGDILSNEDCVKILNKLSTCNLPFQCAHGRPTLTSLLILNDSTKGVHGKLNFRKLQIL